ncbi:MAG TPA: histidine kinase dimerization/phospho-acceptor domain-containing protein [Gaiellaceae bacterium]|nr:histidine kinase dimerization/phospho-acceptor domain-containing protein [Gaiellaceae bacterium]
MASPDEFPRFVSLACHDLRTPLATVSGFAHTLEAAEDIGDPAARYISMMRAAAEQMADLLDALGLVTRIEAGRYTPALIDVDTLELAQAAAERLGEQAAPGGSGGVTVRVDRGPVEIGLAGLALCAVRHGALERVEITAAGGTVEIAPIPEAAAPVVLAEDLKDLGAATARRVIEAIGGSLALEGERLLVRLPA